MPFWDGMTSVEGYKNIRYQNSIFYKVTHRPSGWDNALQYDQNRIFAFFSNRFSNWDYAASRFSITPFSWIDDDCKSEPFSFNRSTEQVTNQLAAMHKWGMDGQFSNYTYGQNFTSKNYGDYYSDDPVVCTSKLKDYPNLRPYNYLPAIKAASQPSVIDSVNPSLSFSSPITGATYSTNQNSFNLTGTSTDNMAIRYVKWANDRGGSGIAKLSWQIISGDYRSGFVWQMDWDIAGIPLQSGTNNITVTVEDTKGLTSTKTLQVTSSSTSPAPTPTPTPPPPAPAKTGDINNDNLVNIFDLSILMSNYGKTIAQASNPACDINNDNLINIFDMSTLLTHYGE
jgi:hypothetical protein